MFKRLLPEKCEQQNDGDKCTIVCFPPGGTTSQFFSPIAQKFEKAAAIFSFDPPNRFQTLEFEHKPMVSFVADFLPSLVEVLSSSVSLSKVVFLGHSVGALVAFEAARQLFGERKHKRIKESNLPSLVILSAHSPPIQKYLPEEPMFKYSDEKLLTILTTLNSGDQNTTVDLRSIAQYVLPATRADFKLAETFLLPDDYFVCHEEPFQCPVLLLGCESDIVAPAKAMHDWVPFLHLSDTNAVVKIFEGADHFFINTRCVEVARCIENHCSLASREQNQMKCDQKSQKYGPHQIFNPDGLTIGEMFVEQSLKSPLRCCLADQKHSLTYSQVEEITSRLARHLIFHFQVEVGSCTGLYLEHCCEYVIAMIATLRAGAAYIPIETAYPQAMINAALDKATPKCVFSSPSFAPQLQKCGFPYDRTLIFQPGWEENSIAPSISTLKAGEFYAVKIPLDSPMFCVMTSGTTGMPKGIVVTHRAAINSYYDRYEAFPYDEQTDSREALSVFFVWEALRPLLKGATAFALPDQLIFEPTELLDYFEKNCISRMLFTPTLLDQIANNIDDWVDAAQKMRSLRHIWVCGEVVTVAMAKRFLQFLPVKCKIGNLYSISECHDVSLIDLREVDLSQFGKYVPVGPPYRNVGVHVLGEDKNVVALGDVGEIYVSGESSNCHYLKDPVKTAERFMTVNGTLMFRTGDFGRFTHNGDFLEIHGRCHFMIKLRGYTVVVSAVEAVIQSFTSLVKSCTVVAYNNEESLQPEHLIAYIVPSKAIVNEANEISQIREYLGERIQHYAIPSFFVFIKSLPISASSGKLDQSQLPLPLPLAQRQKKLLSDKANGGRTNNSAVARLKEIWRDILSIPNHVEIESTNFFDQGGHSLLAIKLCYQVHKEFGVTIPIISFVEEPTLAFLQRAVEEKTIIPSEGTASSLRKDSDLGNESESIAIIGMAGRFPGCSNLSVFWETLCAGATPISETAKCPDSTSFDPAFWGISEKEALETDPQHRIFLECCYAALQSAGISDPVTETPKSTGVFAGCYLPLYLENVLHGGGLKTPSSATAFHLTEIGNDKDYLSTRVSYLFNLSGPSITTQASCGTSFAAVTTACNSLRLGECDMALAGASSLVFPQSSGSCFVEGHIFSEDGMIRTFDKDASGTKLTDGCGVVVLKRLHTAVVAKDRILGVIRGYSVNNDGKKKAHFAAPSISGQAENATEAIRRAAVPIHQFGMVEAHGTGTAVGDPIEVCALSRAFSNAATENDQLAGKGHFCALGSVKPNVGHCNIASGMAALIKTVFCVSRNIIPPQACFNEPNPDMKLDQSPFFINKGSIRDWGAASFDSTRTALVGNLGVGGTNFHIVVQNYNKTAESQVCEQDGLPALLIPFSAHSLEALQLYEKELLEYCSVPCNCTVAKLSNVASTLLQTRKQYPLHRQCLVVVISSEGQVPKIEAASSYADEKLNSQVKLEPINVVLLFSGQGSQYAGMARSLFHKELEFRKTFIACNEAFLQVIGSGERSLDLVALLLECDALPRDDVAIQTLVFSIELSMAKLVANYLEIPIVGVIGHSLGEVAAAAFSGMLSLFEAMTIVVARSKATSNKAPNGAMLSVAGLPFPDETVKSEPTIAIAGRNSPSRVSFSGTVDDINRFSKQLEAVDGIKITNIKVNHPFHHPALMAEAANELRRSISDLFTNDSCNEKCSIIPMISTVTGKCFCDRATVANSSYWAGQLVSCVNFVDAVQNAARELPSPSAFVEVGPGFALGLFTKESVPNCGPIISTISHAQQAAATCSHHFFWKKLGQMYIANFKLSIERKLRKKWELRSNWMVEDLPAYRFSSKTYADISDSKTDNQKAGLQDASKGKTCEAKSPQCYSYRWESISTRPRKQKLEIKNNTNIRWMLVKTFFIDEGRAQNTFVEIAQRQLGQGCVEILDSHHSLARRVSCQNSESATIVNVLILVNPDISAFQVMQDVVCQMLKMPPLPSIISLRVFAITSRVFASSITTNYVGAAVVGPCLTLSQELGIFVRVFDLDEISNQSCVLATLQEVLEPSLAVRSSFVSVFKSDGQKLVQQFCRMIFPSQESNETGDDTRKLLWDDEEFEETVIITGGLGNIGKALCRYILANTLCRHIVALTSKHKGQLDDQTVSEMPPEIVIEAGIDVGNVETMQQLAEKYPMTRVVFHCAGVADMRPALEVTDADVRREFRPKVEGISAIFNAFSTLDRFERIVAFSSLSSILGGINMMAYSAANNAMDAFCFAEHLRTCCTSNEMRDQEKGGCRCLNVLWDDWQFGAQSHGINNEFAMDPQLCFGILRMIMEQQQCGTFVVATSDLHSRFEQWALRRYCQGGKTLGRGAIHFSAFSELEVLREVKKMFAELLAPNIEGNRHHVPDDASFFDLGGDSLLATHLLTVINMGIGSKMGIRICLQDLFKAASPLGIAQLFCSKITISQK